MTNVPLKIEEWSGPLSRRRILGSGRQEGVEARRAGQTRRIGVVCVFLATLAIAGSGHAERSNVMRYIGPELSTLDSYLYTRGM